MIMLLTILIDMGLVTVELSKCCIYSFAKLLAHYKQSTQYVNATQKETRSSIIGVIREGSNCVGLGALH